MCKWNILFLIFLVPTIQAVESNPLSPDITSMLFQEIDESLNKLSSNHEALLLHNTSCPFKRETLTLKDLDGTDVPADSALVPLLKAKFKILQMHLNSQNLAKECPNMAKQV